MLHFITFPVAMLDLGFSELIVVRSLPNFPPHEHACPDHQLMQ